MRRPSYPDWPQYTRVTISTSASRWAFFLEMVVISHITTCTSLPCLQHFPGVPLSRLWSPWGDPTLARLTLLERLQDSFDTKTCTSTPHLQHLPGVPLSDSRCSYLGLASNVCGPVSYSHHYISYSTTTVSSLHHLPHLVRGLSVCIGFYVSNVDRLARTSVLHLHLLGVSLRD